MSDRDVLEMADPGERDALAALCARLERIDPAPLPPLPQGLRERTLAAVPASAAHTTAPRPATRPRRRLRRPVLIAAALAAAVVAAALAVVLPAGGGPEGTLEADTRLAGRGGEASVEVREIGIGRTVDLRSRSLAILPKGRYYEVWFVGPDDSRSRPDRISAGTFHPDAEGRSDVQLKAAVDPRSYPRMEVTDEPGDGDPRASGRVVLAARLALERRP